MIKYFIPFVLALSVIGFLFSIIFEKQIILNSEICGAYKVNRIINETHADEIPIFGSSRAEGGFIPDSFGTNFFNYGMSGIQDNVILFFMREECRKQKSNPTMIINFDLEGLDNSLGDISYYLVNADYNPVQQLLGNEYKSYYNIPFIKYYGQYEIYLKYFLTDKWNLTKFTNKGASIEKNVLIKSKFDELIEERKNTKTIFENDPKLEKELLEILNSNPSRQFVFIISPYHSSYFSGYKNYDTAKSFLKQIDSLPNAKVFDFSHEVYPDSLYMNTSHLNYYGVVKFNALLKDSVRRWMSENGI